MLSVRRPSTSPARINTAFTVPRKPVPHYDPSEIDDEAEYSPHHETHSMLISKRPSPYSEDLYHTSRQSPAESFQEDSVDWEVDEQETHAIDVQQSVQRRRAFTIPNKEFAVPPMPLRLPSSIQPLNLAGISGFLTPISNQRPEFPVNLAYSQLHTRFNPHPLSSYKLDTYATPTARGMAMPPNETQSRRKEQRGSLSKASIATDNTMSSVTESFLPPDLIDTSSPGFPHELGFNDFWSEDCDDDDERTAYITDPNSRPVSTFNTPHKYTNSRPMSASSSRPISMPISRPASKDGPKLPPDSLEPRVHEKYKFKSQSKISILSIDKAIPAIPDPRTIPSEIIDTSSISEELTFERFWARGYDDDERTIYVAGPSASRPISRGSAFPLDMSQKRASANLHVRFLEAPASHEVMFDSSISSLKGHIPFDEYGLPTGDQLHYARQLCVVSESGMRIPFSALWKDQKTVVIFIRHFLCPLCQDYMFSISRNISPEILKTEGVKLVIIGNGSHELIKSYRKIFRTPFAIYSDPSRELYNAMGMTLETMEKGPRSDYVRHGAIGGFGMVLANAVRVKMPIWKNGGRISQLGGEFILGPGTTCSFAHRMRYTRAHLPILHIVREAGVDMTTPLNMLVETTGKTYLGIPIADEARWMLERKKELALIRQRKCLRRGGNYWCASPTSPSTESQVSTPSL